MSYFIGLLAGICVGFALAIAYAVYICTSMDDPF